MTAEIERHRGGPVRACPPRSLDGGGASAPPGPGSGLKNLLVSPRRWPAGVARPRVTGCSTPWWPRPPSASPRSRCTSSTTWPTPSVTACHPRKRHRPVASGELPKRHAVVLGALCAAAAWLPRACSSPSRCSPRRWPPTWACPSVTRGSSSTSRCSSCCSWRPASCSACWAAPPPRTCRRPAGSWLVCSLGALGVVLAKRYTELTNLGAEAIGAPASDALVPARRRCG
mgnify:CR=1 FL=1